MTRKSGYSPEIGAKLARQPNVQKAIGKHTAQLGRKAARILDAAPKNRTGHSQVGTERGHVDGYVYIEDPGGSAYQIERQIKALARAVRG